MNKEKIFNWMKRNYLFVGIILFAIIIRIYYFILTNGQVLWWDEAEYLNIAKRWAFGTDYAFGPVRPILFSAITAVFLKITSTEFLPRFFILILSVSSVIGIYYLGKELYEKNVGLIAAFIMSIFYLNLFFTYRLLVDLPSLTFFILSSLFFYKYFKYNSNKMLYIASVLVAVGTLFKLSTGFLLVSCFFYLIITERFKIIFKKELWIAALIFISVMLPYLIWGYFEFGGFVLAQASAHVSPETYFSGLTILKNYLFLFPTYFSWPILIFSLIGFFMFYKVFLYYDSLAKGDVKLRRDLFVLLIFVIPFILVSSLINHNENRYIITVFPSIMIMASSFIILSYKWISKHSKIFAVILIILILGSSAMFQLQSADSLIKNKIETYTQVKEAGEWLKQNSNPEDIIATKSQPQIRFYSDRKTIGLPKTEEEFESSLSPDVKFFMVSIFEAHPEWAFSYSDRNNLSFVQVYIMKDETPVLIIYKFP